MIRLDVEQGSRAWLDARTGLPTASQFHRLITPKTMKPSEQAVGYRNELLAEYLLGESLSEEVSQFMQRGTDLEDGAFDFYELRQEVDVERVGFILRDDRRAGCSPDGLIGTDGGLELKCPSPAVHIGYLMDHGAGDKYRAQVQGCLWITEREWWDFLSYHPTLPPVIVRCHRDDAFIKVLSTLVDAFCDQLAAAKEELAARGYVPAVPVSPTAAFAWGVG